jgi:ribonuclease P protein component
MRRVLRELFRLDQHEICHVDLIIRVQKKFSKVDYIQIKQEFNTLIEKLNQRVNLNAPIDKNINTALKDNS